LPGKPHPAGVSPPPSHEGTIPLAHYVHRLAHVAPKSCSVNHSNPNKFNVFRPPPSLAHKLQSPLCLPLRGQAGVPLDSSVRLHIGDAGAGSKEEAELPPSAHSAVRHFLWTDDRAHRRTRFGHSIARQSDQGLDARQHRTVDHEGKGARPESRANSVVPDFVNPGSLNSTSVVPDSVNPGPVNPGAATSCPKPGRESFEAPAAASSGTGFGLGGSASRPAHDLGHG
jgi:hypothetical protein